ncbi:MAG: hypothetical protein WCP45_15370 [Verrucomicrobiota bacterium]
MSLDFEDILNPPNGGRVKLVLLGILLPLIVAYFGIRACITEEAICYYRHSGAIVEHGRAAMALGVTYTSVGLFGHVRWFWGLLPAYRVFEIGTVISLLGISGGLCWLCWLTFFAWI